MPWELLRVNLHQNIKIEISHTMGLVLKTHVIQFPVSKIFTYLTSTRGLKKQPQNNPASWTRMPVSRTGRYVQQMQRKKTGEGKGICRKY